MRGRHVSRDVPDPLVPLVWRRHVAPRVVARATLYEFAGGDASETLEPWFADRVAGRGRDGHRDGARQRRAEARGRQCGLPRYPPRARSIPDRAPGTYLPVLLGYR